MSLSSKAGKCYTNQGLQEHERLLGLLGASSNGQCRILLNKFVERQLHCTEDSCAIGII